MKKKEYVPEILFLAALFFFILMWTVVQPVNVSPDEHMRYQIVEYIMKHGTLPEGGDPEVRNELWGISYAFSPITSYIIGAVFGKIAMLFSSAEMAPVIGARMVNVIFGTLTGFLCLRIGKRMMKPGAAWLFATMVCFLPGTVFINSYVNMDAIAVFSTAWILLCWCKALQNGWSGKLCVELGLALSVCALSYYNAYGFGLCTVFFFCISMLMCREKRWDWKPMVKFGLLITAVVLVFAGWWFIRNAILYDGDFLGRQASSMYGELYAVEELKPSNIMTPKKMGKSIMDMLIWVPGDWNYNWLSTVVVSFIGTFGYMDIFMPKWWSYLYVLFFAAGIICLLPLLPKLLAVKDVRKEVTDYQEDAEGSTTRMTVYRKKRWRMEGVFHVCLVGTAVIPVILLIIYAYSVDFQAQGRYLMPMLIPFMYFLCKGFENLIERIKGNAKIRMFIYGTLCVLYVLSAVFVYVLVFLPNYR